MDIVRIRSSRILIGSGIVAAILMVGAVLTRNDPGQASVSPSGFTVPSQSTLPRSGIVAALGVVEPRAGLVDLAPAMPGILAAVHVAEGSSVRRGDVVAELANEDLKAKVGQAEAVLAVRRSHLELIVLGPRQDEIHKAEAQLQEEGANMTWLRQQFERRQALFRNGSVSLEAYNEISSRLASAEARHKALSHALSILRQGSRPQEIDAARAEVLLAESMLQEARANLEKSYIRASRDGIVLRRYREPGEALSIQPVVPVLQIADLSSLVIRAQIDETDVRSVLVGQTVRMTATALRGQFLMGRVERISPRLGAKTIASDMPTEKRDTRVLDVIIGLAENEALPVNFRLDVFIDTQRPAGS